MNCLECKHLGVYHTGGDEYPPCSSLPKCNKGHWFDCLEEALEEEVECKDFSVETSESPK